MKKVLSLFALSLLFSGGVLASDHEDEVAGDIQAVASLSSSRHSLVEPDQGEAVATLASQLRDVDVETLLQQPIGRIVRGNTHDIAALVTALSRLEERVEASETARREDEEAPKKKKKKFGFGRKSSKAKKGDEASEHSSPAVERRASKYDERPVVNAAGTAQLSEDEEKDGQPTDV